MIRLRNWTLQQMLLPARKLHEGTGRHRLYAEDDVYSAALLYALTDLGLDISTVRHLVDGLTQARFAAPKWKKTKGPLYLVVSRSLTRTESDVVEVEPKPTGDVTLIVDLARLWARIEGAS
jgi:DNA-binding transcriptional MerR regulator